VQQPGEHLESRRLAGTIGPEEADDVSGLDVEADAGHFERVKRIYGARTTREAIDIALRRLVGDISDDPYAGLLALEGIGWDGDLDEMRGEGDRQRWWLRE